LPKGREWDVITLIPTREGDSYLRHEDRRGASCWRLMVRIPACHTYKNLGEISEHAEQLSVAEEAGRGMALYGDFTAGMDVSSIANPLPGYRDTALYYGQLRSVLDGNRTLDDAASLLPSDETVLHSTREHFLVALPEHEYRRRLEAPETRRYVELAQREEEFGMTLLNAMSEGRIRVVAIHGDTKLDNFLFSTRSGQAKALVDLDTIMPHTWLADWGDMVRSLVNVAGEKERDLSKVRVDMEIYEALARGFLTTAREVTPEEVSLMVEAVEVISLELGVRFLTDHLRGDTYFKLSPADPRDLNRVRGLVQLKLFERLRQKSDAARQCIERWSRG
jgi:N-acetylhexosamine 1-kinase